MELTNKYEENVVVEMADESGTVYFAVEETGWWLLLETEKTEQLQIACYKLFLVMGIVSAQIQSVARRATGRCTMNRVLVGPVIPKPLPGPRVQAR